MDAIKLKKLLQNKYKKLCIREDMLLNLLSDNESYLGEFDSFEDELDYIHSRKISVVNALEEIIEIGRISL